MKTSLSIAYAQCRIVVVPAVCSRVLNLRTGNVTQRNPEIHTAKFILQRSSQSLRLATATGRDEAAEGSASRANHGLCNAVGRNCVGLTPQESSEAQCPEGEDQLKDEARDEHVRRLLNHRSDNLEGFEDTISSMGLTSESADAVVHSTVPPSTNERAQELAKVVDILSQSLVRLAEQLEALVRLKETSNCSVKGSQVVSGISVSLIRRQGSSSVEKIDTSASEDRVRADEDPASPRNRMESSKRMQKREVQRTLTAQRKGNVKLDEDSAARSKIREDDERFMGAALVEAKKAATAGEVPVGAVIVQKGKIIARAYNRVESDGDPTAHAEMLCLRSAARHHGDWRLVDATLYVTLEPCPMCAGAMLQSRVKGVVWGSRNTLLGADGSWVSLFPQVVKEEMDVDPTKIKHEPHDRPFAHPFHTSLEVRREVLRDDCSSVMRSFFKTRRQLNGKFAKSKPRWLPLQAWVLLKTLLHWLTFLARV